MFTIDPPYSTRESSGWVRSLIFCAASVFVLAGALHEQSAIGEPSPAQQAVGTKIAEVLCGGNVTPGTPVSEQYFLDLEREAFKSLCGEKKTQERIQFTLKTGKTLRN